MEMEFLLREMEKQKQADEEQEMRNKGKVPKPKKKKKKKEPEVTYYRPPGDPNFNSFFIEQKVIHEYLKCPILPWKYPTKST